MACCRTAFCNICGGGLLKWRPLALTRASATVLSGGVMAVAAAVAAAEAAPTEVEVGAKTVMYGVVPSVPTEDSRGVLVLCSSVPIPTGEAVGGRMDEALIGFVV